MFAFAAQHVDETSDDITEDVDVIIYISIYKVII